MFTKGEEASLIWNGVELNGHKKLIEMGITDGDTIKLREPNEQNELSVINE